MINHDHLASPVDRVFSINEYGGLAMGNIRRLVLDVLKPHEPSIIEMAEELSKNKLALSGIVGNSTYIDVLVITPSGKKK